MNSAQDTALKVTVTELRPFFTSKTLAARLALSERTVKDMLKRGVIPSYRVEGARRVDPEDVDRYLAERKQSATGKKAA